MSLRFFSLLGPCGRALGANDLLHFNYSIVHSMAADEEHLLLSGVIDRIPANCGHLSEDLAIGWQQQPHRHAVIERAVVGVAAAVGTAAVSAYRIRGAFYSILCEPIPDHNSIDDLSFPIRGVDAIASIDNFARIHDSSGCDVSFSIW